MTTARELFQKKADAILARVPPDKMIAAQASIDILFGEVPDGDPASIGKVVGPRLKAIEKAFVEPEPAGPSKEEKLKALFDAKVFDELLYIQMAQCLGRPGSGKCIDSCYGQLEKSKTDCPDKTLLVGAYTQARGYLFEQSRIALARTMAGAVEPKSGKVRVSFRGLGVNPYNGMKTGVMDHKNVPIDNDVPLIPGRIWETKWYVRKNFGSDHHAVNQILKYQAAVEAGHFDAVTIEVAGNIDPTFLQNLCEGREVALGLELFAPDVELVYALDEEISVTLKPSRNAKSMARANDRAKGIFTAVLERRYDLFSNKVVTLDDLAPAEVPFREHLWAQVHDGFVDPERIELVGAFVTYETIVDAKRRKAWGL